MKFILVFFILFLFSGCSETIDNSTSDKEEELKNLESTKENEQELESLKLLNETKNKLFSKLNSTSSSSYFCNISDIYSTNSHDIQGHNFAINLSVKANELELLKIKKKDFPNDILLVINESKTTCNCDNPEQIIFEAFENYTLTLDGLKKMLLKQVEEYSWDQGSLIQIEEKDNCYIATKGKKSSYPNGDFFYYYENYHTFCFEDKNLISYSLSYKSRSEINKKYFLACSY